MYRLSQISLFAALLIPASIFGKGAATPNTLSLRVTTETAPAGGVVQIKLILTEPKPIISSKMFFDYDSSVVDSILGIAIQSPNGDAIGTASYTAAGLSFDIVSPSGSYGTALGYPIMTVAVRLKANAAPGANSIFTINLSQSTFQDLTGQNYPFEIKPGGISVVGSTSLGNVLPGGGTIQTGQTFDITGKGLSLVTDLRVDTANKLTYKIINDSLIQATEGGLPFQLDGKRITYKNKLGETHEYYSYPRTSFAFLPGATWTQGILPLMPHSVATEAIVPLTAGSANSAIALWNPQQLPQTADIKILDATGAELARTSVEIPARTTLSVEVSSIPFSNGGVAARVEAVGGVGVFGLSLLNGVQVKAVLPSKITLGAY